MLDCSRCGYKGHGSRRVLPFTSVVGYHMNPLTCGVAKFNAELAKRLGVEWVGLDQPHRWGSFPLLSLKWSEFSESYPEPFPDRFQQPYGVFWHDAGTAHITDRASVVFYADPSLGSPGLWCPSLLPTPRPRKVKLFTFGMASKMQTEPYWKVRMLIESAGLDLHLRVSVGLHEGTSLSDATKHFDALNTILLKRVTVLGCLSDEAVAEELANADCVIAFFDKGVRANNTTVHAALAAGIPVITNHDKDSPYPLTAHTFNLWDLEQWPFVASPCESIYTWNNLITEMKRVCEASRSTVT